MNDTASKRQKTGHAWNEGSSHDHVEFEDSNASSLQDIWANASLFSLECAQDVYDTSPEKSRKRGAKSPIMDMCTVADSLSSGHEDAQSPGVEILPQVDWTISEDVPSWLSGPFPLLYPSVPSPDDRPADMQILNPFLDVSENRHPFLRQRVSAVPEDGAFNGYLKFRIRSSEPRGSESNPRQKSLFGRMPLLAQKHRDVSDPETLQESLSALPPDFGRKCKLDATDNKLLKFCKFNPTVSYYLGLNSTDVFGQTLQPFVEVERS